MLEVIGTLIGIIYLWLEYKASIHLWIVGIIMPAIYVGVFYDSALYAQMGINVYYLLMSVYGWYIWKHPAKQQTTERSITHFPRRLYLPIAGVTLATFVVLLLLLQNFTHASMAILDAMSTTLGIVATWMLARKYVEQWWVWIGADLAGVILYLQTGLYFTAALYFLYAIIALMGYRKWKRLMYESPSMRP